MPHQVSVFLENKPGRIEEITRILADARINIRATTLATGTSGWGVFNLLLDAPEKGRDVLCSTGHTATLREIVIVKVDDEPGGLHAVLSLLANAGLNVENAYGSALEKGSTAVLVIDVENVKEAESLLADAGVATLHPDQM